MANKAKFRLISGAHYLGRTRYLPGDVIEMEPERLRHCLDKFEPVSDGTPATGAKEAEEEEDQPPGPPSYTVEARGGGWYDVIDSATGEPVNQQAWRPEEVEKLLGRKITAEEAAD